MRFARWLPLVVVASSLSAQVSDSTQVKISRQKADSFALIVLPAITKQCTTSVLGFFKPACQYAAPLQLRLTRAIDSALFLSRVWAKPRVDTITRTIYDTLKITIHDTVTVTTPVPVPVDTVKPPPVVVPPVVTSDSVELPRVSLNTVVQPSTRTLTVAATGNLQLALDSAKYGDKIVLAAGATYTGNFSLCTKAAGAGWITVQSAGAMPLEGERISPAQAIALSSPKVVSPNVLPAFQVCNGAQRWRVIGLEISVAAGVTSSNALIVMGDNAYTDSMIPRNIILDRMYVHGTPTLDIHRCVTANADSVAVIDSYISECHAQGIDAQAVLGWNMHGPVKIVNNYLEASTEVVGTGGADPAIANLIPSDIEIRGNHITRPLSWKGNALWPVKTLIEFKSARRVLITGNVLENNWPNAQAGYAVVLYSVNQNGRCTWCETSHVTIERNLLKTVAGGFQLTAQYDATSVPMNHIAIRNNIAQGVTADGGIGFLIGAVAALTIDHNTMLMPASSISVLQYAPQGGMTLRHRVTGNLFGGATYPLFMPSTWPAITDTSSRFSDNVIAQQDAGYYATKFGFPSGNQYPTSFAALGLTADQLGLLSTSPYVGAGADVAKVIAAIAGVVKP